jgi:tRNA pseudouridine65 synthase
LWRKSDWRQNAAMRILFTNINWVAFEKPAGIHMHQPESGDFKIPRDRIAIHLARDLIGCKVYPVHRLDAGTTGILVMAINKESASYLSQCFQRREVKKTYHAIVRGWTAPEALIDIPLELDSTGDLADCRTFYKTIQQIELPYKVGKRHPVARYSFIEVRPETGRYHQIRRHMNRISHPIIGDATHGDSHHNRFFRETLGLQGLCLKAHQIEFTDKDTKKYCLTCPDNEKWQKINTLFHKSELTLE